MEGKVEFPSEEIKIKLLNMAELVGAGVPVGEEEREKETLKSLGGGDCPG